MGGAPDSGDGWSTDRVSKLLTVASGIAGTVVYVYVLGGLVVWARLTASLLYTDSVVDALGSKSLLGTGLKVVAFEFGLLGLLSLVAWFLWRRISVIPESAGEARKDQIRVAWLVIQGLLVAFVAACVLSLAHIDPVFAIAPGVIWVAVGLRIEGTDLFQIARHRWIGWALGIPVVACACFFSAAAPGISALILFALVRNSGWFVRCLGSKRSIDLVPPVLTVFAALSLIILAFLATPPVTFDRVVVVERDGTTVEGGFVARSEDGVFVATCKEFGTDPFRSKKPRLQVIPSDLVKRMTLGGDRYVIDNGKRPSLFDLGLRLFSQDPIEEHLSGWRPSIRGRLHVCVDTKPG